MAEQRQSRRARKAGRLPDAQGFAGRVLHLRELLDEDPAAAGDQALKLLEEYLERSAQRYGFHGEAGMGTYVSFLRGRDALPHDQLERAEAYTQVRNCLAHTYGLQTSPALAAEVLDFIDQLLRRGGTTAAELMTRQVRVVDADEALTRARDLMLHDGFGRIPVLRAGDGVIGLLLAGDVVAAQSRIERAGGSLSNLTAADALPRDGAERVALAGPETSREQIVELLRRPAVVACLITPGGTAAERPIGIITHADLLYRM